MQRAKLRVWNNNSLTISRSIFRQKLTDVEIKADEIYIKIQEAKLDSKDKIKQRYYEEIEHI